MAKLQCGHNDDIFHAIITIAGYALGYAQDFPPPFDKLMDAEWKERSAKLHAGLQKLFEGLNIDVIQMPENPVEKQFLLDAVMESMGFERADGSSRRGPGDVN